MSPAVNRPAWLDPKLYPFQSRVLEIYDQLTTEFGMRPIDAAAEIPNQQKVVRTMVQEILRDYDLNRANGKNGKNGVTSQPR